MVDLYPHQKKAVEELRPGSILCGGVGSGKSRTALAYYYRKICGGEIEPRLTKMKKPTDLHIITTARKRDTAEWEIELHPFRLSVDKDFCRQPVQITIDSWNNIGKYTEVDNAFFIFDEQRVVGSGAWVKSFLKIAKRNTWILLSATPGDTWSDYIPVFIANGFYKNKTEFIREHVIYSRFSKYPKVDRYVGTGRLIRERKEILVSMPFERETTPRHIYVTVGHDISLVRDMMRTRWDPYKNVPFTDAGAMCYAMRKAVNSDPTRVEAVRSLSKEHDRMIVFYNFDYELDILRKLAEDMKIPFAEWNGHKHEPIPDTQQWLYLVQYTAGAEGWNCTSTDTILFYSQSYSYKTMTQAAGRIDRMNTPYHDLYYYHLRSTAPIDLAIFRALKQKKSFNDAAWVEKASQRLHAL